MPVVSSSYEPPMLLSGGHVQTLYASLARNLDFRYDEQERIETPDGDFLDLEWARPNDRVRPGETEPERRVAIVTHGLEGSAQRAYARGMARALMRRGWDVIAWYLRGCGPQMNRTVPTYHSGKTEDLDAVVQHALGLGYESVGLVGFSLGGNMTLKYLGERGPYLDDRIRRAAAISTPVDLEAASRRISETSNWHYTQYFLRSLRDTVRRKAQQHPDVVDASILRDVRTLTDFDDAFTAPLNGFADARDYYRQSSSKPLLGAIRVPTLLLNAQNDPFLPASCYPYAAARASSFLALEVPKSGGHVGFVQFNGTGDYYSEERAAHFLSTPVVRH